MGATGDPRTPGTRFRPGARRPIGRTPHPERTHRRHLRNDRGNRGGPLMRVFVDSNIPMYVAGAEHPNREPATRFLKSAGEAGLDLCTSTEVLQEILFRYTVLGRADLAERVYDLFVALIPEVFTVTLADTDLAKRILLSTPGLSARDATQKPIEDLKRHARVGYHYPGIQRMHGL
ncbi:MAG: type II toxin-antitoxin system VapC family toxin, partial [Gemmatimonadetes bacterium]|nr:type II toxin-antitoxin system VapC family toxin [Gemmatimonadota bacterium]